VINLNVSTATRWGLNGLILLALIVALYLARSILVPWTIALLLAAMVWPAVTWLAQDGVPVPGLAVRRGFPWLVPHVYRSKFGWNFACAFVVGLLVTAALGIAVSFSAAIPKLLQGLPNSPEKTQKVYAQFRERVQALSLPIDPQYLPAEAKDSALVQYIEGALNPQQSPFIVNTLVSVASYTGAWVWESILIMFVLLFFLLEGRMLTRHVVEIFGPGPAVHAKVAAALADMANQIRSYLVWRTIINFAMALLMGAVYYAAGLSQPWTWALLSAILWYVPYLGPIVAGVPPVLDAFVTSPSPWVAVMLLVFYIGAVTVEGYLIVPLVMGRSMELNATTVMLACLFWDLVWGTAGLFLAMPLMAAVKAVCSHVPDWQPWANLMGTREEPAGKVPALAAVSDYLEDTQLMSPAEADELLSRREPVAPKREG
jgi:predicted PurR-regulated permease PerM